MIDPVTGALVIGGINLLGGALGGIFAGEDKAKADAAFQEAQDIIDQIGAPPEVAKEIILDKFRVAGLESPQLEQAIDVGVSKMAQYQEDPRFKDAGIKALERMTKQSEEGLTAQDRLALRQIQQEQERATQGKIAQIRQEAQMRGMGGSGSDLASQLSAAQAGSERGLTSALQVGSDASQRALQSLAMGARQAESMRGADLATARATRGAADEFSRFKAQEAIGRQRANVDRTNLAQQHNIERETEADWKNTAATNAERLRQREAEGTDWDRRAQYQGSRASARQGMGRLYSQNAAGTAQSWGDMAKGTSDIFGSAMNAARSDRDYDLEKNKFDLIKKYTS